MALQRARRPRFRSGRSGRSLRSLGSPLNARPLDVRKLPILLSVAVGFNALQLPAQPRSPVVPSPTPAVFRVGGEVKAPVRVKTVEPHFPRSEREFELGVLILEGIVGRDGRIRKVRILKGVANSYARAAIKAVRQWEYRPATLHGKPVEVFLVITVNHMPMEPDV